MRIPHYRWYAWWYAAISAGFVLLTITNALLKGSFWQIALRAVIAIGFGALSYIEFKTRDRQ